MPSFDVRQKVFRVPSSIILSVGLCWNFIGAQPVDLDLSAVCFTSEGKFLDVVFFNHLYANDVSSHLTPFGKQHPLSSPSSATRLVTSDELPYLFLGGDSLIGGAEENLRPCQAVWARRRQRQLAQANGTLTAADKILNQLYEEEELAAAQSRLDDIYARHDAGIASGGSGNTMHKDDACDQEKHNTSRHANHANKQRHGASKHGLSPPRYPSRHRMRFDETLTFVMNKIPAHTDVIFIAVTSHHRIPLAALLHVRLIIYNETTNCVVGRMELASAPAGYGGTANLACMLMRVPACTTATTSKSLHISHGNTRSNNTDANHNVGGRDQSSDNSNNVPDATSAAHDNHCLTSYWDLREMNMSTLGDSFVSLLPLMLSLLGVGASSQRDALRHLPNYSLRKTSAHYARLLRQSLWQVRFGLGWRGEHDVDAFAICFDAADRYVGHVSPKSGALRLVHPCSTNAHTRASKSSTSSNACCTRSCCPNNRSEERTHVCDVSSDWSALQHSGDAIVGLGGGGGDEECIDVWVHQLPPNVRTVLVGATYVESFGRHKAHFDAIRDIPGLYLRLQNCARGGAGEAVEVDRWDVARLTRLAESAAHAAGAAAVATQRQHELYEHVFGTQERAESDDEDDGAHSEAAARPGWWGRAWHRVNAGDSAPSLRERMGPSSSSLSPLLHMSDVPPRYFRAEEEEESATCERKSGNASLRPVRTLILGALMRVGEVSCCLLNDTPEYNRVHPDGTDTRAAQETNAHVDDKALPPQRRQRSKGMRAAQGSDTEDAASKEQKGSGNVCRNDATAPKQPSSRSNNNHDTSDSEDDQRSVPVFDFVPLHESVPVEVTHGVSSLIPFLSLLSHCVWATCPPPALFSPEEQQQQQHGSSKAGKAKSSIHSDGSGTHTHASPRSSDATLVNNATGASAAAAAAILDGTSAAQMLDQMYAIRSTLPATVATHTTSRHANASTANSVGVTVAGHNTVYPGRDDGDGNDAIVQNEAEEEEEEDGMQITPPAVRHISRSALHATMRQCGSQGRLFGIAVEFLEVLDLHPIMPDRFKCHAEAWVLGRSSAIPPSNAYPGSSSSSHSNSLLTSVPFTTSFLYNPDATRWDVLSASATGLFVVHRYDRIRVMVYENASGGVAELNLFALSHLWNDDAIEESASCTDNNNKRGYSRNVSNDTSDKQGVNVSYAHASEHTLVLGGSCNGECGGAVRVRVRRVPLAVAVNVTREAVRQVDVRRRRVAAERELWLLKRHRDNSSWCSVM